MDMSMKGSGVCLWIKTLGNQVKSNGFSPRPVPFANAV
jgi:hypothetical protein